LDRQFFESTRGRMVTLLRRGGLTVDELAKAVALTNNGVRAHLATLERDGLVRQRGTVRPASGGGKPAYVYELTPEAEGLFPRAYEPVLGRLLDVLSEELGAQGSEALLRGAGRRLAEERGAPDDGGRVGLEKAVAMPNELGGPAELEERDGALPSGGTAARWPPSLRTTRKRAAWSRP
jgi:predicted ArsR family transcriptional regulator